MSNPILIFVIFDVIIAAFGLAIGSFLNVLIDRLPADEGIGGRSHCDYCGKTLQPLQLIPVISYMSSKGMTTCCKKRLSLYYPFIELLTAVLFVVAWHMSYGAMPSFLYMVSFISAIIVIFFADVKYHIIPDEMLVFLLIISFMSPLTLNIIQGKLISGLVIGGGMFLLMLLASYFMKKEAMGFGDVKLAFVMGWYLGIQDAAIALYIAFVLGGGIGALLLILKKRGRESMIAFGPFLLIGMLVMVYFEKEILRLIHHFLF